ncbi:MAG: hypothetical protein OEY85_14220, partial [Rhodospirillales bacterium]|nr:hypothetical protein [Rhodospirillales bacterium]
MSNILTFFWYGVGIYVLPFLFALSVAHATFKIIDCASKAETRTGRIGLSFFAALVVGFSVWVINGVQGGPLGPDVEGALFRPIAPVPALGALILLAGGFFALALGRLSLWRLVVA